MPLNNAKIIIQELYDAECILYHPCFCGKHWQSDALEKTRKKLLECLAWIEQSGLKVDKSKFDSLRNQLSQFCFHVETWRMIDGGFIESAKSHQEFARTKLIQIYTRVRSLI